MNKKLLFVWSIMCLSLFSFAQDSPCKMPSSLTASSITPTSAAVSWSAASDDASYTLEYKTSAAATWTILSTTLTSASYNFSGLNSATTYNWRVKNNCGSAYKTGQFTTKTCPVPDKLITSAITSTSATISWTPIAGVTLYTVAYKASNASSWTYRLVDTSSVTLTRLSSSTSYTWGVKTNCGGGNNSAYQMSKAFTTKSCDEPKNLTTSEITTTSATVSWAPIDGIILYTVAYKLSTATSWTYVTTPVPSVTLIGLSSSKKYNWGVKTNCGAKGSEYTMSQFTTRSCEVPKGLTTSAITSESATVSWTAVKGVTSYTVGYKLSNASSWTYRITDSSSMILTGLGSLKTYKWNVKTNCGTDSSAYAESQFTTLAMPCVVPTNPVATSITPTSAILNWSAVSGAASYTVEYKLSASSVWTVASTSKDSASYSLNGLNNATTYDWRVRTNCSTNSSGYATGQFTTQTLCAVPTNPIASSITATSVVLSWSAVSDGNASYTVEYKPSASTTWTVASTAQTSTSYNLSDLNSSTTYNWRVKTNCSNDSSVYAMGQFTTSQLPCVKPVNLSSSIEAADSITLSWDAVNGTASYIVMYKQETSTTWTTINTMSTSVRLTGLSAGEYSWGVKTNCNTDSSAYTMSRFHIKKQQPSCISAYEDNQTLPTASAIPVNTTITAAIGSSTDVDFYKFVLPSASNVTIALENLVADYDLGLYNASGRQLASSQNEGTTKETITGKYGPGTYYVKVSGYNEAYDTSACYNLSITTTSQAGFRRLAETKEMADEGIQVFPNPATTQITVQVGDIKGQAELQLLDSYGKLVRKQTTSNRTTSMDISTLPSGIYILKIKNGIVENTIKIVKQ